MAHQIEHRGIRRAAVPPVFAIVLLAAGAGGAAETDFATGEAVYRTACVACHGADGRGAPPSLITTDTAPPDFTDCDFAQREPDGDWVGIAFEGGPSRGFSEFMPAFEGTLTIEQIELAVSHIRTFCTDQRWPRGEFNVPRALVTSKAYPEDEVVLVTTVGTEDLGEITNKLVYEQRFGPKSQWEVVVPFGWIEVEDGAGPGGGTHWGSSMGDIALAVKHVLYHDLAKGSIISAAGEVILPTGDDEIGFGKGTTVFEPFVSWGQLLRADFFLQMQGGLELSTDRDTSENAAFLRAALGWTGTTGRFGRAWSPMVELTADRDFGDGSEIEYTAVPQIQITLNKRQHVMLNIGFKEPLNFRDERSTQVVMYLLWDWFDGTFFEGW